MMNAFHLLLASHIFGSILVGVLVSSILFIAFANKTALFKPFAAYLGIAAGYQLATGSLLAIISPEAQSLFAFCSKIGLYLSVILVAEVVLYMKIKQNKMTVFPVRAVSSSIGMGMLFVFTVIVSL